MRAQDPTLSPDKIGDEQDVKFSLSLWLEYHGVDVYWERENDRGYPTFTVSGVGGESPDLLVDSEASTVAVEVKNNQSSSSVYDAHTQTVRYWRSIPDAEYTVGGDVLTPDGVVVATQSSPEGRLFTHPPDRAIEEPGEGREMVIKRGILPAVEFCMTEQFTRLLLRHAKRHTGRWESGDYIGALLSANLDGSRENEPKILRFNCNGERWRNL